MLSPYALFVTIVLTTVIADDDNFRNQKNWVTPVRDIPKALPRLGVKPERLTPEELATSTETLKQIDNLKPRQWNFPARSEPNLLKKTAKSSDGPTIFKSTDSSEKIPIENLFTQNLYTNKPLQTGTTSIQSTEDVPEIIHKQSSDELPAVSSDISWSTNNVNEDVLTTATPTLLRGFTIPTPLTSPTIINNTNEEDNLEVANESNTCGPLTSQITTESSFVFKDVTSDTENKFNIDNSKVSSETQVLGLEPDISTLLIEQQHKKNENAFQMVEETSKASYLEVLSNNSLNDKIHNKQKIDPMDVTEIAEPTIATNPEPDIIISTTESNILSDRIISEPKPIVQDTRYFEKGYLRSPLSLVTLPKHITTTTPFTRIIKTVEKTKVPSGSVPILKSYSNIDLVPDNIRNAVARTGTQLFSYDCKDANGFYGIENSCDSYVECKRRVAFILICPDGLHFNSKAIWPDYPCSYPFEVKCENDAEMRDPQPSGECPRQYGYFPSPDNECSKFIMCQEGKANVLRCPVGLSFNTAENICDWPENVPACRPSVFIDFTCPKVPEDDPDVITKHRYKESCKEYVACQREQPRLLSCDAGLAFDADSQVCVDADFVQNCK